MNRKILTEKFQKPYVDIKVRLTLSPCRKSDWLVRLKLHKTRFMDKHGCFKEEYYCAIFTDSNRASTLI